MTIGDCVLPRLFKSWYKTVQVSAFRRNRPRFPTIEALECRVLLTSDTAMVFSAISEADLEYSGRLPIVALADFLTEELDGDQSVEPDLISEIKFPSKWQVGQLGSEIVISLTGLSPDTLLDLAIDWNRDGSFAGASEMIATLRNAAEGEMRLRVDVPSFALSGPLSSRLLLTSTRNGIVQSKTFALEIVPPNYPSGDFGQAKLIDSSAAVQFVSAADLDRDGDMDLLSATFEGSGNIVWYRNDGDQNFARQVISDTSAEATSVLVADVNADGYLDVVASSLGNNTIVWYENDGLQNFTSRMITDTALKVSSLFLADLNRDGTMDIVAASKGDNLITWYENNGAQKFTRHIVTNAVDAPCSVFASDMNGDGYLDIVSASFSDNKIAWYQNDGSQVFSQQVITTAAGGVRGLFVSDLDGDGYQDIVASCLNDNSIIWLKNDGHGVFSRLVISSTATGASTVYVADMDGDGDLDVLGASRGNTTAAWFENRGDSTFPRHIVTATNIQARGIIAADVDGDGDLDVVSGTKDGDRLAWFENTATAFIASIDSATSFVTDLASIPVTLVFNRPVPYISAENLVVENGVIANFRGQDLRYSFDVIPNQEGKVTVKLDRNSVTDEYGIGNSAALLTREVTREQPKLFSATNVATFIRNSLPVLVAGEITVSGSRLGGGTLVLVLTNNRPRWSHLDIIEDSKLQDLGELTRWTKGNRQVTSIKLNSTTTADSIQSALRSLTFSSSKMGLRVKTRELTIQLVDNSEQSKSTITQSIEIPSVLESKKYLQNAINSTHSQVSAALRRQ